MKWYRVFCYYKDDGFFWCRIFGRGIVIKDINKHYLTFSERKWLRNGYSKYLIFGRWLIRWLPYTKL